MKKLYSIYSINSIRFPDMLFESLETAISEICDKFGALLTVNKVPLNEPNQNCVIRVREVIVSDDKLLTSTDILKCSNYYAYNETLLEDLDIEYTTKTLIIPIAKT